MESICGKNQAWNPFMEKNQARNPCVEKTKHGIHMWKKSSMNPCVEKTSMEAFNLMLKL